MPFHTIFERTGKKNILDACLLSLRFVFPFFGHIIDSSEQRNRAKKLIRLWKNIGKIENLVLGQNPNKRTEKNNNNKFVNPKEPTLMSEALLVEDEFFFSALCFCSNDV